MRELQALVQVIVTHDGSLWPLTETCMCAFYYETCSQAWGNASYHVIVDDFLKALSTLFKTFLK